MILSIIFLVYIKLIEKCILLCHHCFIVSVLWIATFGQLKGGLHHVMSTGFRALYESHHNFHVISVSVSGRPPVPITTPRPTPPTQQPSCKSVC